MNQNYAVIENNIVTNVIVFDPNPQPKSNWVQSDTARIGDTWDGKNFVTPTPEPAPVIALDKTDLLIAALVKKGTLTENDISTAQSTESLKEKQP